MVQLELNLPKANRLKREGVNLAEQHKRDVLDRLQSALRYEANRRQDRTVTADTAYIILQGFGYPDDYLGNAAGSIFKSRDAWEHVDWVPSERVSNHGRYVRRWRLRG
jgi:hypothetical protein